MNKIRNELNNSNESLIFLQQKYLKKALIMAGGFGSRMKELTKKTPKPMLKLQGRPILDYSIELCKMHGINDKNELVAIVEKSLKQSALWDEVKDKLNKNAFELSGGQQQRLCIARSLAVDPEILLLDEPCSDLDPIATLKIEDLLIEFKNNLTIVIVTHNMQQASRISDYTAFFWTNEERTGFLVEYNTTAKIFSEPKDKRTEDYITGRFG